MTNPFRMKDVGQRLKNKGVWTALLLGLLPLLANAFGFPLPVDWAEIVYATLGILVTLGILANPKEGEFFEDEGEDKPKRDE